MPHLSVTLPFQLPYDTEREVYFRSQNAINYPQADHVFALKTLDLEDATMDRQLNIETWTDPSHGVEDQLTGHFTVADISEDTELVNEGVVLDFSQPAIFEDFVLEQLQNRRAELVDEIANETAEHKTLRRYGRLWLAGGVLMTSLAFTFDAAISDSDSVLNLNSAGAIISTTVGISCLLGGLSNMIGARDCRKKVDARFTPELGRLNAISEQLEANGIQLVDYSESGTET